VLDRVRDARPDLGLVYGSPILRPALFEIPTMGTLGIHHGTLPRYRGKKTTFWEMFEGQATAGVTIQIIERGLDTGRIVKQDSAEIGARSRSSVWRELEERGLDAYEAAILDMRAGTAEPRAQEGPRTALYRDPPISLVALLAWRQTMKRVFGGG
jgi:methionyl-tRNA formyltransferase